MFFVQVLDIILNFLQVSSIIPIGDLLRYYTVEVKKLLYSLVTVCKYLPNSIAILFTSGIDTTAILVGFYNKSVNTITLKSYENFVA